MHRARTLAALAAFSVALAGCGSGHRSRPSPKAAAAPGPPTDLSRKPAIRAHPGPPPRTLIVRDLVVGHGQAAKPGETLTVRYVGVAYSTGREFDASWDRGEPFQFELGRGIVIRGWDRGIVGMRVGGRRQLVIPPALAYGVRGQPPRIAPNETLIFDVDLVNVQ